MSRTPFGKYLRKKRTAAKISFREVADHIRVPHVTYGEVERGVRAPLSEFYWSRLCEVIPGVTIDELRDLYMAKPPTQENIDYITERLPHLIRLSLEGKTKDVEKMGRMIANRVGGKLAI